MYRRFIIFSAGHNSESEDCSKRVSQVIKELGGEVFLLDDFSGDFSEIDIAISIGGDGTFLRTASAVGRYSIPILGINTGRLGFLAAINYVDMEETLKEVIKGEYELEERSLLQLTLEPDSLPNNFNCFALNEVAIFKQDIASMLTVHASINGQYLTSYQADGLIVATPTGSTAYSLSNGGSILSPDTPTIILSAIAPHNLTSRSLVVNDSSVIKLEVESRNHAFLVSVDGNSLSLEDDTSIIIRKATHRLKVINRVGYSYFQTLRDKLLWGVDIRHH